MTKPKTIFIPRYQRDKERNKERFKYMDHFLMNHITEIVCDVFNVSSQEVRGQSKPFKYVIPRQTIAFFGKFEEQKLWYIALYLGYQEHGVIIHSINHVREVLLDDKEYLKKFKIIQERVAKKDYVWQKIEKSESLNELNNFY